MKQKIFSTHDGKDCQLLKTLHINFQFQSIGKKFLHQSLISVSIPGFKSVRLNLVLKSTYKFAIMYTYFSLRVILLKIKYIPMYIHRYDNLHIVPTYVTI
jgi:hypothetical protein